jgi:indole-3-acetate monooxygenase
MTNRAKCLLGDIWDLVPDITSRSTEIEAGRRIPLDLVAPLRSIGVFRIFVPQSHGGLELDLPARKHFRGHVLVAVPALPGRSG